MAAEKRTQYDPLVSGSLYDADVDRLTSLTDLGDGSHDRANVPGMLPTCEPFVLDVLLTKIQLPLHSRNRRLLKRQSTDCSVLWSLVTLRET